MKNKILGSFLISACTLAALPVQSLAGIDIGNGGDGIILNQGKSNESIIFFDTFERGIDVDRTLQGVIENPRYRFHPIFQDVLFEARNRQSLPRISDYSPLSHLLARLADLSPSLTTAFIDEMNKLRWSQSFGTLQPNPDTKPFIDLKDTVRIGCGRNMGGTILYSPECIKLSSANMAAFITHEVLYSIYRKLHPNTDNSFNVRTVTSAILDTEITSATTFQDILNRSGFETFPTRDEAIQDAFFDGNFWYSKSFTCSFKKSALKTIRLSFSGAMQLTGEVTTSNTDDLKTELCGSGYCFDKAAGDPQVWSPSLPRFDLKKKALRLGLGREFGDGESLTLAIQLGKNGTTKAIAIGNGFGDKPIYGTCK